MRLNVHTDANVILANKLQKLNRSAFPVAVRQALDSTAFEMKKKEIERSANKRFQKRHPGNIYRRFTRVKKAQGFDVSKMEASAGWTDFPNSDFAENQKAQQHGGKIDGRTFIPTNEARSGSGQVKARFRLSRLKNQRIIDAKKVDSRKGKGGSRAKLHNRKQKFVVSAIAAKQQFGTSAFVISQFEKNGSRMLHHINTARPKRNGLTLKTTPIYSVRSGRKVSIKRTNYMFEAGEKSAQQMDKFFEKSGKRQFKKVLR